MYSVMMKHAEVMGEIDEALENPHLSKSNRKILLRDRKATLKIITIYLDVINIRTL